MEYVREMCWHQPCSIYTLMLYIICMAMQKHPEHGLTVLYHPEAELVGKRKRMLCQTLIPDLEYADDMCVISDSVNGKGKGKGFLF